MVTAMDRIASTVSPDEYQTSIGGAIEKEIAAIFDAEVHKAAREISKIIGGQSESGKRRTSSRS